MADEIIDDNHESWCDTENNISTRCNCLASGYIEEIEKLQAELEKEQDKVRVLREALEKYADKKNWRYQANNDVGAFDAWLDFKPDHYCKTSDDLGGFIAREALQKIRGEK